MRGWQHVTFCTVHAGIMCIMGPKCVGEVPVESTIDAPPLIFAASAVAMIVGSILPDIDSSESFMGRRLPFIGSFFSKHRGVTHSIGHFLILSAILIAVAMFAPIPKVASFAIYGLLFGYASHLFLDLFSKEGIPVFWSRKKYDYCDDRDKNVYIHLFRVYGILSVIWMIILIALTVKPLNILFQILLPIIY